MPRPSSSTPSPLLDRLASTLLLADGAAESALAPDRLAALPGARAIASAHDYPIVTLALHEPEVILNLHRAARAAGATVVRTVTRSASPWRLGPLGVTERPSRLTNAAARLAREAVGKEVLVLGVIGPMGPSLSPHGTLSLADLDRATHEQLLGLLDAGVDGIVIEGMTDAAELFAALATVRDSTSLPIIALKTFHEDGATLAGTLPGEISRRLVDLGADVIGASCAVGPQRLLSILERMRSTYRNVPLAAFPSGGMGRFVEGRLRYAVSPAYLAESLSLFRDAGVRLLGGCCGITTDHIAALAWAHGAPVTSSPETPAHSGSDGHDTMHGATEHFGAPPGRSPAPSIEEPSLAVPAPGPAHDTHAKPPSRLAAALGREFVVTVELDIPRGLVVDDLVADARAVAASGLVHALDITDGARARLRMHPLAICHRIQAEVGLETICHLACRDRNVLALQSDLLAAHAFGQQNLLPVTGDPPNIGDFPHATAVFDVDSIGLVRIIAGFNDGHDLAGNPIGGRTAFLIAVAANPTADDLERELERLAQKVEAGAHVVLTQPLFEVRLLERFVRRVEQLEVPVLVGVLPLRSSRHADFLHNEVAGVSVPESIRDRMRRAGDQAGRVGVELARAFVGEARRLAAGIYLMPPFKRYELVGQILDGLSAGPGSSLSWTGPR